MTHDQHVPAAAQVTVPIYDGEAVIASVPVDRALAEILERNGYRLVLDTSPLFPPAYKRGADE